MDAKENLLRAIKQEDPAYVPWALPREYPEYRHLDEGVMQIVGIEGNAPCFGQELVDNWGTHWVPIGGVDTQYTMTCGTLDEVRRETLERLKLFGSGGGYIAAPDQGMPFPMENVQAFVETVRGYGRYPLEFVKRETWPTRNIGRHIEA